MTAPMRKEPASRQDELSPSEYAEFIRQIELEDVWLSEAKIANRHGPEPPSSASIEVASEASWSSRPGGFDAFHAHRVRLREEGAEYAEIEVTFGLRFSSGIALTDRIFAVFQRVNLPVNTWPYLREFVAGVIGRMTWIPFTLPVLKRGTGARSAGKLGKPQSARETPKERKSRAKDSQD